MTDECSSIGYMGDGFYRSKDRAYCSVLYYTKCVLLKAAIATLTRKLCYRKDDRAMCAI